MHKSKLDSGYGTIATLLLGLGLLLSPLLFTKYLHDQYTAIKWCAVYATSTLLLLPTLFCNKPTMLPRRPLILVLSFCIPIYILGIALRRESFYEGQILDIATFVNLLCISAFLYTRNPRFFISTIAYSLFAATSCVLAYGFLQKIGVEPFPELFHNNFPASFFGFQNMTAEFVGLSIVMQMFALPFLANKIKIFVKLQIALAIPYLLMLHCRAIYVGLLGPICLYILTVTKSSIRTKITKCLLAIACLALLLKFDPLLFHSTSGNPSSNVVSSADNLEQTKSNNIHLRLIRWMNTLSMIYENPWGTGPGSYEFAYLPYKNRWQNDFEISEQRLSRSPHNTYLSLTAENGVLMGAFLTLLLLVFMLALLRKWRQEPKAGILTVLSLLLFLATEALFAFPTENAVPFFLIAIFCGVGLTELDLVSFAERKSSFVSTTIVFILCSFLTYNFILSSYTQAQTKTDQEKLTYTCKQFPSHWRNCSLLASIHLRRNEFAEAEDVLQYILRKQPENFVALRQLSHVYFRTARPHLACQTLESYNNLFAQESSLNATFKKLCPRY